MSGTTELRRARGVRARLARLVAAARAETGRYVAAVGIRTASRAAWSLALPVLLTVPAYGEYSILAALIVLVVQAAVLGGPQAIVRASGGTAPVAGIVLHALVVGAVVSAGAVFLSPSGGTSALPLVAGSVALWVLYTLFGARAKGRFAFGTAVGAEAVGGAVLLAGPALLLWLARGGSPVPARTAILVEAAAVGGAALTYLLARRTRFGRGELSLHGTRQSLPAIYTVGLMSLMDVAVLRRVEVYFLEHSSAGLVGVAVISLAVQLSNLLLLLPTALLEAWQPRFALTWRTDRAAFVELLRARGRTYVRVWALVVAAAVVAPAVAIPLALPKYAPWLWTLVGLIAVRVLCGGAGVLSSVLYAIGEQRWLVLPCAGGAAVALASNAVLTLPLGLSGAVAAQLLTQGAVAGLTCVAFLRARRASPALAALGPAPRTPAGAAAAEGAAI